jgi:ATPase family AAA domain-containing protein 3A/B
MVDFELPSTEERVRLIKKYIETHLLKKNSAARPIQVDGLTEDKIREIAEKSDGFSGRSISKLAIAWQAIAYAQVVPILTEELVDQVSGIMSHMPVFRFYMFLLFNFDRTFVPLFVCLVDF